MQKLLKRSAGFAVSSLPGLPAWLSELLTARGIDTPEKAEAFLYPEKKGLNDPFLVRYFNYMAGVLHGDFGTSWYNHYDVGAEIKTRLSITLVIALGSMIVQIIIGLPIGIIAAVKQYSFLQLLSLGVLKYLSHCLFFYFLTLQYCIGFCHIST